MFKVTGHNKQLNLFGNVSMNLTGRASRKYDDPDAWHNQFYELVTSKVDESVFRPLFKDGNMGAPTKGLCRLVEKRGDRWRARVGSGKNPYRYFTRGQVDRDAERRRPMSIPKERLDIRNNVEATIFQYCFHTRNNKTRYRGLAKHRMQAVSRCAWSSQAGLNFKYPTF